MGEINAKAIKEGGFSVLGCGVGLRPTHYQAILDKRPQTVDWFEAVTENYLDSEGRPLFVLEEIRKQYPIGLHGVALSVGSADPLNQNYLKKLKKLIERIDPEIVSDHLCWSSVGREELHDLLPLPFTEEALSYLVQRIDQVQSYIGRRILVENVSSYVTYKHSTIPEYDFITQVAKKSGCGILLDINNIYVNGKNHGFDPLTYLDAVPGHLVGQFHIAGHLDRGKFLFDTHEGPIVDEVWDIYREALKRYGQVSSLIEWDTDIPEFFRLEEENARAREIYDTFPIRKGASAELNQRQPEMLHVSDNFSTELKDLQTWFKQKIYSQEDNQANSDEPEKMEILNAQAGDPGVERLKVYAEGHLALTEEALAEVFEATKHLVGANTFSGLVRDYIHQHHSEHYNLNVRGAQFPGFLAQHHVSQDLPFLEDLAKLEWLKSLAYHEHIETPVDLQEFSSLAIEDWERACFEFQPKTCVLKSIWPIYDLWQARKTPTKEIDIQVEGRPQAVLVGRSGLDVIVEPLEPNQAEFLEFLLKHVSLGAACEQLIELAGRDDLPVMEWFQVWAKNGMISAIKLETPAE